MQKHWLTLYADTFLWLTGSAGLAYNAKNKRQVRFSLTNVIDAKCRQLLETSNLYSIELTDKEIRNEEINQWVQLLINIEAGYLSYNVEFENKPVSLQPILKVQDKNEHYELQHTQGKGGVVLQNLHELSFYINGSEYGSNAYYKQHIFPVKDRKVLDNSRILSFIKNSRNPFLCNINIIGNLFLYPDFEQFFVDISNFSIQCTIHIMTQDLLDNIKQFKAINWPEHIQFNVLVDSVFDVALLQDISAPFSITAFVVSENEYVVFSNLFESLSIAQEIQMIPLYNGENIRFFESCVFTDKDEIEHIELSKNEIFMRQSLNIGNFGKLTVMPDGNVYDNVNASPLGTINDSPYSLVYKEFIENRSWFRIREQAPCSDCIYQWLCPSPTNYEMAIGRNNLCHVKESPK